MGSHCRTLNVERSTFEGWKGLNTEQSRTYTLTGLEDYERFKHPKTKTGTLGMLGTQLLFLVKDYYPNR